MLKITTCAAAALFAVLSACPSPAESQQPPALNEDAPPPLTNGIYIDYGACPGEGCSIGFYLRATEEGTIVDGPTADAAAIGVTKPHEWLQVVDTQDRLIPRRGVLLRESEQLEGLKAGDVVFMLGYEGEGCSTLYRRGKSYSWCDYSWSDNQEPEIKWDEVIVPPELANQIGFGVQIRRADGQAGWLGAGDIQCAGAIDATRDCPFWLGSAQAALDWAPPNDIDQYWGREGSAPEPWADEGGLYAERLFCPGQDCYIGGSIRTKETIGLVGVDVQGAPVAAALPAREWVWVLGWEHRVGRTPGVVRVESGNLKVGDRVYALSRPTPGCAVVFHGYFQKTVMCATGGGQPGADVIDWGEPEAFDAGRAGLWVTVKRQSSGTPLYVREADLGKFACVTLNNRDADCPAAKIPAPLVYEDPATFENPN